MSKTNTTSNIYNSAILTKKIYLNIDDVNSYIRNKLESKLKELYEDKCNIDGFIKKNSIKLLNYSSGKIDNYSNKIMFQTTIQCQLCNPVNNMIIDIKVLNITKAGIRGDINIEEKSPIIVFLARDHHYNISEYSDIKENDVINVKILGHRFELNDDYISVIAEYKNTYKKKPKIIIPSLNLQQQSPPDIDNEPQEPPTTPAQEEPPTASAPEESPKESAPQVSPTASAPQEPPTTPAPQEPPTTPAPQEPPTASAPQEPPTASAPQEPPTASAPQEPQNESISTSSKSKSKIKVKSKNIKKSLPK